jgi:hypothetical protein
MPIHSPEFQKKKKKRLKLFLIVTISALVLLVSSAVYASRRPSLLISDIYVGGNQVTSSDEIKRLVGLELQGRYFWLIPRSNAFLYPRKDIQESLKGSINRIKSVETSLSGSQTLNIQISEREPFALYCEDISELYSPSQCYFLDNEGFIFSIAPSFSGDVYFVYSTDEPLADPIGKYYLPAEEFSRISLFRDELSKMDVNLRAFKIAGDEYKFILPTGGEIKWQREDDVQLVLLNLQALLFDDSIRATPGFIDKVVHIDLRLKNKIFYKLKEE